MSSKSSKKYLETYKALRMQVHNLYFHWCLYLQLYGNSMRVNLLNKTAPDFFCYSEKCHIAYILLGMTKLTDNSNDSLTFTNLIHGMKSDGKCICDLDRKFSKLKAAIKTIRYDRNKIIAHLDHKIHTKSNDIQLKTSRKIVKKSFANLRILMTSIEIFMNITPYDWNADIQAKNTFTVLKSVLNKSLLYDKMKNTYQDK